MKHGSKYLQTEENSEKHSNLAGSWRPSATESQYRYRERI